MLKLHHAPNSRAGRVLWLLEELGLKYELNKLNFHPKDLKSVSHRAKHPLGRVPVLDDGDVTIFESGAIIEYLIARHSDGSLRPGEDTSKFPEYLQWFHYCEGAIMPPMNTIVVHTMLLPEDRRDAEVLRQARNALAKALQPLEKVLEGREYLLGEFSGVDFMVGHSCYMSRRIGSMSPDLANLNAYIDRIEARPAFSKAVST